KHDTAVFALKIETARQKPGIDLVFHLCLSYNMLHCSKIIDAGKPMTSPSDKPTRLSQRAAPAWQAADNAIRNRLAKTAMGLSPIALTRAYMDWALQMSVSPGRRSQLGVHAFELMAQAWQNMLDTSAAEHASDNDLR